MERIPIGARLRQRRKTLGVTQAALAARVGISASYLNLIEADRRNIGGALLKQLAEALGAPIEDFGGAAQRRLVQAAGEVAAEPLLAPLRLDPASAPELVARHPRWAQALVDLRRAYVDRSAAVAALSDRLHHDPFVAQTVHSMLTNVSAIRSAAEILEADDDLAPAQRQRFVAIVADDSRKLSDVSQALAGFFSQSQAAARSLTPAEEVDDFFAAADNHFPGLEVAGAALARQLGLGARPDAELTDYLQGTHGVTLALVPAPGGPGPRRRRSHYDARRRTLEIAAAAPETTVRFALARLAARLGAAEAIDAALAAAPASLSAAAAEATHAALLSYTAAAVLLPYEAFQPAARALRYDLDALARQFHASFEQVCHRLVTLRRPGAAGVRFGLLRCDAAGRVTKRFALPGLALPGQGPGCPLWALFAALQAPGSTVRQLAQFPGGDRYLLLARAVDKEPAAFGMPRHLNAIMLVCEPLHARQLVYGDGLDLSEAAPTVPVGQGCRVCARQACPQRQEDPILGDGAAAPGLGEATLSPPAHSH